MTNDLPDILVVEDQEDVQKLLGVSLKKHCREIRHALDASEAWEMILQQAPDIILLDIMMPGEMDGMDLLLKIREQPSYGEMVIIVMSALTQRSDFERAMAAGADDYLCKPFHLNELHKLVQNYS